VCFRIFLFSLRPFAPRDIFSPIRARAHFNFHFDDQVDFSKARLNHAVISNCQFTGANVTGASFHGVVAVRTDVPFIIASSING
jgi:hypothetical protein